MQQDIQVIIIEDDPLSAQQLSDWIQKVPEFQLNGIAETGKQAIQLIQQHKPDVIFTDIELPDMNGFEIIEKIELQDRPYIVFTTAHNEHAIKAFEIFALDYLLKPFDEKRFQGSVKRIIEMHKSQNQDLKGNLQQLLQHFRKTLDPVNPFDQTIPVKTGGKIHFVTFKNIEFIQASSYYIEIFAEGKKYLLRETLSEFLTKLPTPNFIRIHRSVIINLQFMKEIEKVNQNDYQVKLKNNQTFRISKSYRKKFFEIIQLD